MKRKRNSWWLWALLAYLFVSVVGLIGTILDLPFAVKAALAYSSIAVILALVLAATYVRLAPLRTRTKEWSHDGTLVFPITLDPATAPVGSRHDKEMPNAALVLATSDGLEIRCVNGESLFSTPWDAVAEVRIGHSTIRAANITVIVEGGIADQEWWLVPINSLGFNRRSDPVFDLIDQLLELRDSAVLRSSA